jgi:hypothetical protein
MLQYTIYKGKIVKVIMSCIARSEVTVKNTFPFLEDLQFLLSRALFYDTWHDSLDGGSARRKASICIKHRNTRTNIYALSGIRTHGHSIQAVKTHTAHRAAL